MAYIQCRLKSEVLQTNVPVSLYFPCDLPADIGNTAKASITLLHGYTGDCDDWMYMTAACRYAADNQLVLIVPSVNNSFYADMVYGGAYFTFITQEMPALLNKMFHLPQGRENNFIAGLSMGGYGALMIAMRRPDLFSACAAFSGALDAEIFTQNMDFSAIFGKPNYLPEEYNLYQLAKNLSSLPPLQQPRLLITCGKQDDSYFNIFAQNQKFIEHCKSVALPITAVAWDGVHEWNFWDRSLVKAIGFFLQNNYNETRLHFWQAQEEEL